MSLGIVLAPAGHVPGTFPYGISSSMANRHRTLEPYDPQWNTRGEAGYYHDTQLGTIVDPVLPSTLGPPAARMSWLDKLRIKRQLKGLGRSLGAPPTDAEMASVYGYTPTVQGWVNGYSGGQQIFWPGSWNPPSGVRAEGYYPPVGLSGLRDAAPATAEDVIGVLAAHNDRTFALALVSTVAVTTSALISIFRTLRLIRRD